MRRADLDSPGQPTHEGRKGPSRGAEREAFLTHSVPLCSIRDAEAVGNDRKHTLSDLR